MPHDQTAPRLLTIGLVMLIAATLLKFATSARWFDLYGVAIVGLIGAGPILATLMRGLERRGHSRWLAVLVIAPMVIAALVQLGYWTAFFSSPKTGIPLGMGRMMLGMNAGGAGWIVAAVVLAVMSWVLWLAIGPGRRHVR